MADISKIQTPDGTEYNIKDTTARSDLSGKQATITASGVLIGDGSGGVTAKTLDTSSLTNDNNHVPTSGVVKSAIEKVAVRPNLLRNWYFVGGGSQQGGGQFPINQRGQTSYAGSGYAIDGWLISHADMSVAVQADSLAVNCSKAYHHIEQRYENYQILDGKTVTLSAIVQGTSGNTVAVALYSADGTTVYGRTQRTLSGGWDLITETIALPTNANARNVAIYTSKNGASTTLKIATAKLELGGTQTLAHNEGTDANPVWVLNEIPDYTTELLRCQRYFQTFRTQELRPTYGADFRPVMATATPTLGTITIDGVTYYTASSES